MSKIYKYYKQRLVEISGKNRSLFSKKISQKFSYDLGGLFADDEDKMTALVDFLWSGKKLEFEVIGKGERDLIYKNLNVENKLTRYKTTYLDENGIEKTDYLKLERLKKQELKKTIMHEVSSLKQLKRELEDFERETGRYELYVGYPFVEGYIGKDLAIRAPLILFPITINIENETTASIELISNETVKLNKVLLYAYANSKRLGIDELETEFDELKANGFKNVDDIIDYLKRFEISIKYEPSKTLLPFEQIKEPKVGTPLEIKHYCVLGRFPLTNSIYNDYDVLEKKQLTTPAIDELLFAKEPKQAKRVSTEMFPVSDLDFAQQNTIKNLNKNANMVIYGPPGTGKSQTIVNIITDALTKGKKVLVVSQKKAAIDVVYNRLAGLNRKAILISDSEKAKAEFYQKAKIEHESIMQISETTSLQKYYNLQHQIDTEISELQNINSVLFDKQSFGLNLQQMYANSEIIGKNSSDYTVFQNMQQNAELMAMNYSTISEAQRLIKDKKKDDLYFKFLEKKQINPLINYIKSDIDIHTLSQAQNVIKNALTNKFIPFDMTKRPYARDLLSFYLERTDSEKINYAPLTKYIATTENPKLYSKLKASHIVLPMYPFIKSKTNKLEKEIESTFDKTLEDLKQYIAGYEVLSKVLEHKGYLLTLDNIVSGNTMYLKMLANALDDYVDIRDINACLNELTDAEKSILNFAYKNSDNYKQFKYIVDKIIIFRTYNEVIKFEESNKETLSKLADFSSIRNRILSLQAEQHEVNKQLCYEKNAGEYKQFFNDNPENSKNFLYQISKQKNMWSIRKSMQIYKDYLLKLFPCFLLSPETASQILPLEKEMFDLVVFDEASQVFIENTLPCIYRGKNIVVAGDAKQLRPTATFLKRYMGNDDIDELDYSTQAALEVESLLDLATSRYSSSNLTYHYRSRSEALINFSNYAFYAKKLQIAPDISKNSKELPIERIKVDGRWINTCNREEAKTVATLLCKLLKDKKRTGSIGIITFNLEQENAILDEIDALSQTDEVFRNALLMESNRKENGEDISLFVKNLENVQGDERDIIIFSIGYAQNEYGKVIARFGSLSNEGGENRLNVAITRAKQKIYVITSIEPEELNVAGSKNIGPKLFKEYLRYARVVSKGNKLETRIILENLLPDKSLSSSHLNIKMVQELSKMLKDAGYNVENSVGNADYKLPIAIYDKKKDKYLLGIEFDYSAFDSSNYILERDVYHPDFMKSRGWEIFRVWSRDWWLNKHKVVQQIVKKLEKLEKIEESKKPVKPKEDKVIKTPKKQSIQIDTNNFIDIIEEPQQVQTAKHRKKAEA